MNYNSAKRVALWTALALACVTANAEPKKNCTAAGGLITTNFGAVDASTTMGYATGDLKGAVGATILNQEVQNGGATLVFTVQHHWVTDSGDTLAFDQAKATVQQVGGPQSTLYGVSSYSAHLNGGTGKFAGATGDFNMIGEADFATGQLVFRYTGTICYSQKD